MFCDNSTGSPSIGRTHATGALQIDKLSTEYHAKRCPISHNVNVRRRMIFSKNHYSEAVNNNTRDIRQ